MQPGIHPSANERHGHSTEDFELGRGSDVDLRPRIRREPPGCIKAQRGAEHTAATVASYLTLPRITSVYHFTFARGVRLAAFLLP